MTTVSLNEVAEFLRREGVPVELEGDGTVAVQRVERLATAGPGDLSFLSAARYRPLLATTGATALLVEPDVPVPASVIALRCPDPYAAMALAMELLQPPRAHPDWGVDPRAVVSPDAVLGENPRIGPHATVESGARIGRNAVLYPGSYVGENAVLGDDVVLHPNVVVYDGTHIGHRVVVHAGTVIGHDGLGFAMYQGRWVKIRHAGRAVIEDDVEIGANACVDRATIGETRVRRGTKLSSAVLIGHGSDVGEDCILSGQVGLGGSTTTGRHVMLGGQVGVAGHVHIGDQAKIAAQSGLFRDVDSGAEVMGSPPFALRGFWRRHNAVSKLPDLRAEVKELRRRLEALERERDRPEDRASGHSAGAR